MALYNALAEAVRQGKQVQVENGALDASGLLVITTGFATIDSVQATVEKATAPTTSQLTFSVSGSTVTIRGWKATATADTALIASDALEDVSVVIVGRRRN